MRAQSNAHVSALSILIGFFFSLLDTTIVSTSLIASSEDLHDFRDGSWVVLAYLLTYMGQWHSIPCSAAAAGQ